MTLTTEETWRWRVRWGGKMTTMQGHWTEAEIRREHPEAVRIEGSMVLRPEPVKPVANRVYRPSPDDPPLR